MQPKNITITTLANIWQAFVNSVHQDQGAEPTAAELALEWTNVNTVRPDPFDQSTWTLPDPATKPTAAQLLRAWNRKRSNAAEKRIVQFMRESISQNTITHARRAAEAQMYATVDAEEKRIERETTVAAGE